MERLTQINKDRLLLLFLTSLIFFAILYFYVPLLKVYYCSDDMQFIWLSATKTAVQLLFSPVHYRALSGANFTPLLGLSFKLDWTLFRMEPFGYNLHNLTAVLLAAGALFLLLREYSGRLSALAGSLLFVMSPVTVSVFEWSSTRHYTEGLFFALLSVFFFLRSQRSGRISFASPALYLVAALFKEVYVVLPLVVLLLSRGNVLLRLRSSFHLWIALLIYMGWRFWMLEGMGGYPFGDSLGFRTALNGIYRIFTMMPLHLFGPLFFLFYVLPLVMFFMMNNKKNLFNILFLGFTFLIPILPVSGLFDLQYSSARYVFPLSIYLIGISVIWGSKTVHRSELGRVTVPVMFLFVIMAFWMRNTELVKALEKEREISKKTAAEFVLSGKEYVVAEQPSWFYLGLRDISEYYFHRRVTTKLVPSSDMLRYLSEERKKDLFYYGFASPDNMKESFQKNAINGSLRIEGYKMYWEFGPYEAGKYYVLRGYDEGLYYDSGPAFKRKGMYLFGKHYPNDRPLLIYLRILYKSPEGWEGITDEYKIEVPGHKVIAF